MNALRETENIRNPVPANERRVVVLIRILPLLVLATVIAADAQQLPGTSRPLLASLPDAPQPHSGVIAMRYHYES